MRFLAGMVSIQHDGSAIQVTAADNAWLAAKMHISTHTSQLNELTQSFATNIRVHIHMQFGHKCSR